MRAEGVMPKDEWRKTNQRKRYGPADAPKPPSKKARERDDVYCPRCGTPMVIRHNRADGSPFYGCRSYPQCRGTKTMGS